MVDVCIKIATGVYEFSRARSAAHEELCKTFGDDLEAIRRREEFIIKRLDDMEALIWMMDRKGIEDIGTMREFIGDSIIDRFGPRLGKIVFDGTFHRVM